MVEELLFHPPFHEKRVFVIVSLFLCYFMESYKKKQPIELLKGLSNIGARCSPLLDYISHFHLDLHLNNFVITL